MKEKSAGTVLGEHMRSMQVTLPAPHSRPGSATKEAVAKQTERTKLRAGNDGLSALRGGEGEDFQQE